VENIYCNWSGGSAFGSLGVGVDISHIHYRNVYTINSNQMMMIKSNGGSGSMRDVVLENFIGHRNAYSLDIDQHWSSMKPNGGTGVALRNITFKVSLPMQQSDYKEEAYTSIPRTGKEPVPMAHKEVQSR
jgi:rhamnogalacturonan hydrolase